MIHPPLYKKDSKGKTRFWQIEEDGEGSYRSIAGLTDGNPVTSEWTVCEPKNVGRSNETTPTQQCASEVTALYQKKRDKHYVDSSDEIHEERKYFEVMLAGTWSDKTVAKLRKQGLTSLYSQPKLDGLRGATCEDGVISRGGNEFLTVRFIRDLLQPIFDKYPGIVIDGELYNHDLRDDFNEIVSTIKRDKPTEEDIAKAKELVQLHVYDCFLPSQPDMTFLERMLLITVAIGKFLPEDQTSVVLVRTDPVYLDEPDKIQEFYDKYLEEEYEGQMIRANVPYAHKRVDTLLKRKVFKEAEFPVVRIESGSGNWSGAAKRVICALPDGRPFGNGIRGTRAYLRQVLAEAEQYKMATSRYFNETPDGIPRFGVVKQLYKGPRDD